MIFKWEGPEEKLKRYMRISARKKLEWLNQMHEFMLLAYSKKQRDIFWKIRGIR